MLSGLPTSRKHDQEIMFPGLSCGTFEDDYWGAVSFLHKKTVITQTIKMPRNLIIVHFMIKSTVSR